MLLTQNTHTHAHTNGHCVQQELETAKAEGSLLQPPIWSFRTHLATTRQTYIQQHPAATAPRPSPHPCKFSGFCETSAVFLQIGFAQRLLLLLLLSYQELRPSPPAVFLLFLLSSSVSPGKIQGGRNGEDIDKQSASSGQAWRQRPNGEIELQRRGGHTARVLHKLRAQEGVLLTSKTRLGETSRVAEDIARQRRNTIRKAFGAIGANGPKKVYNTR